MRLLRMEVISSGLICMRVSPWRAPRRRRATCLRSCSRRLRMDASRMELPTRTTRPPRMSGSTLAVSSTVRPVCSAMRSPICLIDLLVELDRRGDLDRQELVLLAPRAGRTRARMRKSAGMRWFSTSSSRKFDDEVVGAGDRLVQALLLLLAWRSTGENRNTCRSRSPSSASANCAELLADRVELVVRPWPPRTASARRPWRSPPSCPSPPCRPRSGRRSRARR